MDEVETELSTEQPTLEQITQAVLGQREALSETMAQEVIVRHYAEAQAQQVVGCSQCGRTLRARGTPAPTVSTLVGELQLERPYFILSGVSAWIRSYPLDSMLALSERRKQADVQPEVAKLTKEAPRGTFATAIRCSLYVVLSITEPLTVSVSVLGLQTTVRIKECSRE